MNTTAQIIATVAVVVFPIAYAIHGQRAAGKRRAPRHPWRVAVSGLLAKAGWVS